MAHALQLAERGLLSTMPNPRVGCVLLRDGAIVGEGWHRQAGQPHAEIEALRIAGDASRGSTAYVTLEPCAHHGRTPPCADALIAAGVTRVVVAMKDPNPLVAGRGLERLRAAGVRTECGLMNTEALDLNIGFVSRMTRGRPWIRLKVAATLDGKTALNNGISQWITGAMARRDGHRWRARACAILTGIGTVLADDPQLNVREIGCERQPWKVLIDARLEVPAAARVLAGGQCLVATASSDRTKIDMLQRMGVEVVSLPNATGKVDLAQLMQELGRRAFNEVHVEAGFKLNGSLMREACIDELLFYMAPKLIGDNAQGLFNLLAPESLDQSTHLEIRDLRMIGQDLRIIARLLQRP